MKRLIYITGILFLIFSGISCNDDFLSKNNIDLYKLTDTLKLNNSQTSVSIPVQLPVNVDSDYTIFMQPKWLSFSTMHGEVENGSFLLDFSILKNDIISAYKTHYATVMVNVEDLGMISFTVAYENYGSPILQCLPTSLDFKSTNDKSITIKNTSEGILKWSITGLPQWLTVSTASGSLLKDYSATVSVSLNQDKINLEQETSGSFQIISNSTTGNITIPVHVDAIVVIPSGIQYINGIVTDAEYNQNTGIMAIVTKSPDKLILFNTNTNESDTLPLQKSPVCISLSEDGHKAVIGYTISSVSYIDLDNLQIIRDYVISCIPYDIVLGDNSWCYITPTVDQWESLRNLNLITGEVISGDDWGIYEKTIIRKIPARPFMIGTQTGLSTTEILIFNLTKGKASDTISTYFTSLGNFWISKDGARLYAATGIIYRIPEYDYLFHANDPPVYGQLDQGFQGINALDECPDSNCIYFSSAYWDYDPQYKPLIDQYNVTTLNKIRTYNLSPVYLTENGTRKLYETSARYIFVKKDGSKLYAIKNLRQYYNKNYWTIEIFNPGDRTRK